MAEEKDHGGAARARLRAYLAERGEERRVELLTELRATRAHLPLSLVADLLLLDLSTREEQQLLRCLPVASDPAVEDFLLDDFARWRGPTAHTALEMWSRTAGRRQTEVLRLATADVSETLLGKLLEWPQALDQSAVLTAMATRPAWPSFGAALTQRVFARAAEFCFRDERLVLRAERLLQRALASDEFVAVELPDAARLLASQAPERLADLLDGPVRHAGWRDLLATLHREARDARGVEALIAAIASPLGDEDLLSHWLRLWPSLPARRHLGAEVVARLARRAVDAMGAHPVRRALVTWEAFTGIERVTLAAIAREDASAEYRLHDLFAPLLGERSKVKQSEAAAVCVEDEPAAHERRAFLRGLFCSEAAGKAVGSSLWTLMANKPRAPEVARQLDGVYVRAFCAFAARAADAPSYVRRLAELAAADDEDELVAVAQALAAIAGRAASEALLALALRTTAPVGARIAAARFLAERNEPAIASQLHAAARAILDSPLQRTPAALELAEILGSVTAASPPGGSAAAVPPGAKLEERARKVIPGFAQLPEEVKAPLRTAELLAGALKGRTDAERFDAGAVVALLYKSLEIFHRLRFEEQALRHLARGTMQRQLEDLGYGQGARGHQERFETELAGLPTIRDIPDFSPYKLRSLLGSVAAFRPGRRFTFDGLKSYGLFFLTFSRRECPFGLARMFPLNVESDGELFEYVRLLSILHDLRNRAVHYGLPVGADTQGDGLWSLTGAIAERAARY